MKTPGKVDPGGGKTLKFYKKAHHGRRHPVSGRARHSLGEAWEAKP